MIRPEPLAHDDVASALAATRWLIDGEVLRLSVELPSFAGALGFVVSVGALAEAANHHPDIDLRYRTVHLVLSTHDAGALTELDVALALKISGLGGAAVIETAPVEPEVSDRAENFGGWRQSTQ